MRTVAIFNLVNSSNCGDKLIAEVIKNQLEKEFIVKNYDILANFCSADLFYNAGRLFSSSLVSFLPGILRHFCVRFLSSIKFFLKSSYYSSAVRDCDFVVIGGGQLFRDNDGYMACALEILIRAIEKYEKNFAVIGCGASGRWGRYAAGVFKRIFESPFNRFLAFRDSASPEVLRENCIFVRCKTSPDTVFALGEQKKNSSDDFFGICLASPRTVFYYGKRDFLKSVKNAEKILVKAILEKIAARDKILLFCNGNPEDYHFAKKIKKIIGKKFPEKILRLERRPENVADLKSILSLCESIYSYRMHVAILSALFSIPCELERWDSKTEDLFFDEKNVHEQIAGAKSFFSDFLFFLNSL